MAGAAGACQAVWLTRLLGDIAGANVQQLVLKMDNQSAIALSKNPVLHDRSKHIDMKFHFIHECVESGSIFLDYVSTQEQLANILTKSLERARFCELRDKIGVVKVGQPVLFRINGYPGQDFAGKVRRVDPAANAVTRQVAVLVDFNDKEQPRVAGLYAEGRIETDSISALMIPDSALVKAGDVTYTWKVKDKALHKVNLRIGARDVRTGQWEVQSGLASGDTVLRTPGSTFKDGQKVELTAGKAVPAAAVASSSSAVAGKGN